MKVFLLSSPGFVACVFSETVCFELFTVGLGALGWKMVFSVGNHKVDASE